MKPVSGNITAQEFADLQLLLTTRHSIEAIVVTDSMEPLLPVGTSVRLRAQPPAAKLFDVIVFFDGTKLICHYLKHINRLRSPGGEQILITRGLRYGRDDLPILASQVLGVVESHALSFWKKIYLRYFC